MSAAAAFTYKAVSMDDVSDEPLEDPWAPMALCPERLVIAEYSGFKCCPVSSLSEQHRRLFLAEPVLLGPACTQGDHGSAEVLTATLMVEESAAIEAAWASLLDADYAHGQPIAPEHPAHGGHHHETVYLHLWPSTHRHCPGICLIVPLCDACVPGLRDLVESHPLLLLPWSDSGHEVPAVEVRLSPGAFRDAVDDSLHAMP